MMNRISTNRPRLIAAILATTIGGTSLPLKADPSPTAIASAKALVADGRHLRDAGDNAGARDKFKAAWALVPTPIIGLDLARAYVANGQLVEARDVVTQIDTLPTDAKESPEGRAARDAAKTLSTELKPRIPTVVFTLSSPNPPTLSVSLDGDGLPLATIGQPLKVNPGHHIVIVRSASSGEAKTEFTIEEHAHTAVELAVPTTGGLPNAAAAPSAPDQPHGSSTRTLTYVGFAIAGSGVLIGAITGGIALSKASSVKSQCVDYRCPPPTHDDFDSSRSMGTISTVAFAIGGAGALVGIYGLLSGGERPADTRSAAPRTKLWIGATAAGVTYAF